MESKICTRCKTEQDVENFYVRRTRNNQRKSICKECESKQKAKPVEIVPDLEGEVWKDVVGFEGVYVVSNLARLKRIMHRKNPTNTLMESTLNPQGYFRNTLCLNGKRYEKRLARLVAMAHIPNPENKPEVNHIGIDENGRPGNKNDNRAISLEWSTSKENIDHAWENGLSKPLNGIANGNSVLTEKEVLEIRAIKGMTKRDIAKLYNIGEAAVGKIINGKRWKHLK